MNEAYEVELNYLRPSSEEVNFVRAKSLAFCSSDRCLFSARKKKLPLFQHMTWKKGVKKHKIVCPDCGHSLFWTTDKKLIASKTNNLSNIKLHEILQGI